VRDRSEGAGEGEGSEESEAGALSDGEEEDEKEGGDEAGGDAEGEAGEKGGATEKAKKRWGDSDSDSEPEEREEGGKQGQSGGARKIMGRNARDASGDAPGDLASLGGNPFPADPLSGAHPIIAVLMPPSHSTGVTQELAFTARASVGSGSSHVRYCPVSVCGFAPLVDAAAADKAERDAADKARFRFLERPRLFAPDPAGSGRPAGFRFFLETACGLSPADVVLAGFEALAARLRAAAADLADPGRSPAVASPMAPDAAAVRLRDQSSTLGAVLQAEALDGMGADPAKAPLAFLGYHAPHPLEPFLVLKGMLPQGQPTGEGQQPQQPAEGKSETGDQPRPATFDAADFRDILRAAAERGALKAERLAEAWSSAWARHARAKRVAGGGRRDYGDVARGAR
jgi:hypothetical protein